MNIKKFISTFEKSNQNLMKGRTAMRMKLFALLATLALTFGITSRAQAIIWGQEDLNGKYPNVVSVRGIVKGTNIARYSCSGSLLHIDNQKVVILTAAHCTDTWAALIAVGELDSVGYPLIKTT